jgi:hypothetical protein
MPLPQDLDLPTDGYLLPSAHGLALPECSWLLEHNRDSLKDIHGVTSARQQVAYLDGDAVQSRCMQCCTVAGHRCCGNI